MNQQENKGPNPRIRKLVTKQPTSAHKKAKRTLSAYEEAKLEIFNGMSSFPSLFSFLTILSDVIPTI